MKLAQSLRNSTWEKNRSQKQPPTLDRRDSTSLEALGTEIASLIEETVVLKEIMLHKPTRETLTSYPHVNVLNRTDRSVAFLAGYSSKISDCPLYFEDAPIKCLVTYCSSSRKQSWDCLGLSFSRGMPCEQLWSILAASKHGDCSIFFDLPGI